MQLIKSKLLMDFPSGSSINYDDGKLLLIGDDAQEVLILDKDYSVLSSIKIFDYQEKRTPKPDKVDLESAIVVKEQNNTFLLALGSASKRKRKKALLIPLNNSSDIDMIDTSDFIDRLESAGLVDVNIEGATRFGEWILLANRGDRGSSENRIIITENEFWHNQRKAGIFIAELFIDESIPDCPGVSEICYVQGIDTLFITLSCEATMNAYDDGAIGDSYVAWIRNFSAKVNRKKISVENVFRLTDCHADFKGEKIEGICFESFADGKCIAHLVSDNDSGQSKLFKIEFHIDF